MTQHNIQPLSGGNAVTAIIPNSIETIWRVATMVVEAGLAPYALVKNKQGKEAQSAVAMVIMSGAELGLPPMVALRSFTVINGRPALFGDGLINVCRRSGKAEYIRTGFDKTSMSGWCEAKRLDTGEEKRVEFSIDDAKRAGLTDAKPDSPWIKYPQRMLAWRAAGYCLRELFADVLGGMTDEFEAREIEGHDDRQMRDITPPTPPTPPAPPPEPPAPTQDATIDEPEQTAEANSEPDMTPDEIEQFIGNVVDTLALAKSVDQVNEYWDELEVDETLTHHPADLDRANDAKKARIMALADAGDSDLFKGSDL